MKVKLLISRAVRDKGQAVTQSSGDVVTVGKKEGEHLIAKGWAEEVAQTTRKAKKAASPEG